MKLHGRALRLTVFIGDTDTWHHKPLHHEIVRRAHAAGLAGASVFHGVEGYGASKTRPHHTHPVAAGRPAGGCRHRRHRGQDPRLLPQLDDLISEGLIILDEVEMIRYVDRTPGAADESEAADGGSR